MINIWDEFARYIFNVEVEVESQDGQQPGPNWGGGANTSSTGSFSYAGGHSAAGRDAIAAAAGNAVPAGIAEAAEYAAETAAELPPPVETVRLSDEEKVGRNDPCPCGSGKKYKKCHGANV
jgi:preprotein translocase subunit SecA